MTIENHTSNHLFINAVLKKVEKLKEAIDNADDNYREAQQLSADITSEVLDRLATIIGDDQQIITLIEYMQERADHYEEEDIKDDAIVGLQKWCNANHPVTLIKELLTNCTKGQAKEVHDFIEHVGVIVVNNDKADYLKPFIVDKYRKDILSGKKNPRGDK